MMLGNKAQRKHELYILLTVEANLYFTSRVGNLYLLYKKNFTTKQACLTSKII